jgi:probable phosphomutase (TIGR03848 family)
VYFPRGPGDESRHTTSVLFDLPKKISMATYLLIRHALCDPVGRSIAGRTPGITLNPVGRRQAEALASRLAELPIAAVYSSPLERAVETARPIAERKELPVQQLEGLNEIDFGEWTGRTLAELSPVPEWQSFNRYRSVSRIPGGETMLEVLTRTLKEFDRLQELHPDGALVALVSHADVLRSAIAHFLGMPLDLLLRLELGPASVSIVELQGHGPRLLLLNSLAGPIDFPHR